LFVHSPPRLLQLATAGSLAIETLAPVCMLLFRGSGESATAMRIGAAACLVLMNLSIMATGSFGYVNLLSAVLCLTSMHAQDLPSNERLSGPWSVWGAMGWEERKATAVAAAAAAATAVSFPPNSAMTDTEAMAPVTDLTMLLVFGYGALVMILAAGQVAALSETLSRGAGGGRGTSGWTPPFVLPTLVKHCFRGLPEALAHQVSQPDPALPTHDCMTKISSPSAPPSLVTPFSSSSSSSSY